jgi:hypothetical protein
VSQPSVTFRLPLDEARQRYAACDICCVDLDQCVFPTFTQTVLGTLAVGRALVSPTLWPKLPRLLGGGYYLAATRLRQITGRPPTNNELMARFSAVMGGMPMDLIERLAKLLPRISFPGWRDSLALISARMPIGLLSFAIQPIIEAYRRTFGWRGKPIFDLASGTPVEVAGSATGPVLLGCYDDSTDLTGPAKLRTLMRWMEENEARVPLVIGHGPDEAPMADFARQRGGLSIGFRADSGWAEHFDLVVDALTWRPVTRLLRLLRPST